MSVIKLLVYAQIDHTTNEVGYGVYTLSKKDNKERVSIIPFDLEMGIWDGIVGSGVGWAEDCYNTLENLVSEIAQGVKENREKSIFDFEFYFDFSESLSVTFHPKTLKPREDVLTTQRPLTNEEREQFSKYLSKL